MKKSNIAKTQTAKKTDDRRIKEDWAGGTYRQGLQGGYDCQIMIAGVQERKRVRLQAEAKEWLERMAKGKDTLTTAQAFEALQAFELVKTQGNGKTLLECLRCGLDSDTLKSISLQEAVQKYLLGVTDKTSKLTSDNYKLHLGRVSDFLGEIQITQINDESLKSYTDTLVYSPQTYNHFLRAFRAFWNWSIKQKYTTKDPTRYHSFMEVNDPSRAFLTVPQAKLLLTRTATMYPELMPYIVLGLFAGIRPFECARLTAKNILMHTGYIRIDEAESKTAQGRNFEMSSNLKAWLELYPVVGNVTNLTASPINKRLRRIDSDKLVGLTPDCLRHSFATYSIAANQDAKETSLAMGHSEDVNKKHYRGLATQQEGKAYFNLTPEILQPPKLEPVDSEFSKACKGLLEYKELRKRLKKGKSSIPELN